MQWCSQPLRPEAHSSTSAGKQGCRVRARTPSLALWWAERRGQQQLHQPQPHWSPTHLPPTPKHSDGGQLCGQEVGPAPSVAGEKARGEGRPACSGHPGPSSSSTGTRLGPGTTGQRGSPMSFLGAPAALQGQTLTLTATAVSAKPVAGVAATLVPAGGVGAHLLAARGVSTVVHVCGAHGRGPRCLAP